MEKRFFVAVKALIFHDGKFLLIKRTKDARGDYYQWEFPGGRVEFGETPVHALHREIQEETGLFVECLKVLNIWNFMKDEDTEIVGITYLCMSKNNEINLSKEHDEYKWIKHEELENYHLVRGVSEELKELDWIHIKSLCNLKCSEDGK